MGLGWRHLVPRRRYFRSMRVAKACPEIVWHIEEQAKITAQSYAVGIIWWPTIGLLALLFGGLTVIGGFALTMLPRLPDHARRKGEIIEAAWRVLPLDEIRARLGEEVPRILSKKADY